MRDVALPIFENDWPGGCLTFSWTHISTLTVKTVKTNFGRTVLPFVAKLHYFHPLFAHKLLSWKMWTILSSSKMFKQRRQKTIKWLSITAFVSLALKEIILHLFSQLAILSLACCNLNGEYDQFSEFLASKNIIFQELRKEKNHKSLSKKYHVDCKMSLYRNAMQRQNTVLIF